MPRKQSIVSRALKYKEYAYTIGPQFAQRWISVAYDSTVKRLLIELYEDDKIVEFAVCAANKKSGENGLQEIARRACERENNSVFRKLAESKGYANEVSYFKICNAYY